MKISECEKIAENFLRLKKPASDDVKITSVKPKDPYTYEVKGYCEPDLKFTLDVSTEFEDVVGYDFVYHKGRQAPYRQEP